MMDRGAEKRPLFRPFLPLREDVPPDDVLTAE